MHLCMKASITRYTSNARAGARESEGNVRVYSVYVHCARVSGERRSFRGGGKGQRLKSTHSDDPIYHEASTICMYFTTTIHCPRSLSFRKN